MTRKILAVLLLLLPVAGCDRSRAAPVTTPVTINIGLADNSPGFSDGEPAVGFDVAFKDQLIDQLGDPDPPQLPVKVSA
ncbi:hypothetical protein [Actinoplanes sp. NPDC049265]|uniref:hypothetical protein n=1 Tax=Actinoplanes sp. NPDC049265 TaxID=3363902 RepID=UPI003710F14D